MNAQSGEKSILEAKESMLDKWMYGGMLAVLAGVIIETIPDLLSSQQWLVNIVHRIGGSIVALGLLDEFIVDIKARRCRARLKEISDIAFREVLTRATRAEQAAAEANLARVKLESQLFKPHVLTEESRSEMIEILKAYPGCKRAEVFVYDGHLWDVFTLADSINATFGMSGWRSNLWIGPEPRMVGTEAMFGIARECADQTENAALQQLAWRLLSVLSKLEIRCSVGSGAFSTDELPRGPLRGWGIWDPRDVAMFRVQIGQRQLTPDLLTWPVTPPQA